MGDFLYNRNHTVEPSQAAMDVSAKVMVAAIIVLFMIIVFVILLHLYAKWSWNRRAAAQGNLPTSNRLRRSRFVFAPNQVPVVVTSLFRGLEPSVIKSLPVVTFTSDEFKEGLECAVCLSELTQGEKARLLPKCNHGFHVECIDMWFQSHSTCPLCRNPIADDATSNPELPQLEHNPIIGFSLETPNFPTNVLFWGDQTQVSTRGSPLEDEDEDEDNSSSSSPSFSSTTTTTTTPSSRPNGDLVIDVPQRMIEGFSSMSPSTTSRFTEEDLKSPMTTRLRSFRRLLSREKKIVPCSPPNSIDLEQGEGGRGQSSKTASDSPNCYTASAVTTAADRVDDMST